MYYVVAKALRDSKPDDVFEMETWKKIVYNLANDFQSTNRNFSKNRFYKACDAPQEGT